MDSDWLIQRFFEVDARTDNKVDAALCAGSAAAIERTFATRDLPRLLEAGAGGGSTVTARFQFAELDGRPAIEGELTGEIVLTCQRCMTDVNVTLEERFDVIIVADESDLENEPGGYDAVVADATRLDLRWLAEEQALLALPLVAMHEPQACAQACADAAKRESEEHAAQKPFASLRDMMRQR